MHGILRANVHTHTHTHVRAKFILHKKDKKNKKKPLKRVNVFTDN